MESIRAESGAPIVLYLVSGGLGGFAEGVLGVVRVDVRWEGDSVSRLLRSAVGRAADL